MVWLEIGSITTRCSLTVQLYSPVACVRARSASSARPCIRRPGAGTVLERSSVSAYSTQVATESNAALFDEQFVFLRAPRSRFRPIGTPRAARPTNDEDPMCPSRLQCCGH